MKRFFLLAAFAATTCLPIHADDENKKPVIIHPILAEDNFQEETSRAPVRVPSLFIEEHTLTFTSSCVGCTLQLWHEGILVYTYDILDTDDVVLPSDLTGEYEIRLLRGAFTFVGTIEL